MHFRVDFTPRYFLPFSVFGQDQKAPKSATKSVIFLRKILLVSVKFVSAILGPETAAPILWTPGKMRSFCRKTHVHKIPRFGGGFGGGGECRFYFYGREDFSEFSFEKHGTKNPPQDPFLKSPCLGRKNPSQNPSLSPDKSTVTLLS